MMVVSGTTIKTLREALPMVDLSQPKPLLFITESILLLHLLLSDGRRAEPPLGIEPRIIDYKSIVIPFNYRGKLGSTISLSADA